MRECFGGFAGVRGAVACGDALGWRISSPFVWTCSCALWADARCCCFAARGAVCTLRGCTTLPLARMRDAVACAGARRCRLRGCAALTLAGMLWGGAFRRRSYGHARVRFGQTRVVAALQPEGLYALCAGARRCRLRECATLSLARVRDAVACASARRFRLRGCAVLPHARMRGAAACADARRYRLRGCATLSLARVRVRHIAVVRVVRARLIRLRKCACTDRRASLSLARAHGTSLSLVPLGCSHYDVLHFVAKMHRANAARAHPHH